MDIKTKGNLNDSSSLHNRLLSPGQPKLSFSNPSKIKHLPSDHPEVQGVKPIPDINPNSIRIMAEKHRRTQTAFFTTQQRYDHRELTNSRGRGSIERENHENDKDEDDMLHMLNLTQAVMSQASSTHDRLHGYVKKQIVAAKDTELAEAEEKKRKKAALEKSFHNHRRSQSIGLGAPNNRLYN